MRRPRRDHKPVSDRAPVHVGVDEKVHEPTKLAAVFDNLVSQGFAAEEILRSSQHHMTGEDTVLAIGFSDAANFRHAFRRWTRESPSEFRYLATGAKLLFDR